MPSDAYIPRSLGDGCTAEALYRQLRERRMSKFEACQAIYTIIRTWPDVVTDPLLPAPLEIIPHPDNETITIMAGKLKLDGSKVRMSTQRPAGIEVPNACGRREQWDWPWARNYAREIYRQAVVWGGDEPDIVAEVRLLFARKHGRDKNGQDIVPSDRSLRDHVQQWREAGDYTRR
jgi:hypothetical protein